MKNIRLYIGMFCTLLAVSAFASPLYADIYVYIDKAGVRHFTNAPTSSEYKLYLKSKPSYFDSDYSYSPSSSYSYWSNQYDHLINQAAELYGIPFPLVKAMIKVESNFNPKAVSPKGAQGLMQIIPATANFLNIYDVFDPEENIKGGTRYLRYLLDRFDGKWSFAIAGYNAGPERVERHQGIPPIKETQNYVKKVIQYYKILKEK